MRHYAGVSDQPEPATQPTQQAPTQQTPTQVEPAHAAQPTRRWDQDTSEQRQAIQDVIKTICDEEALDRPSVDTDAAIVPLFLTAHIGMIGDRGNESCGIRSTAPGQDIQGFRIDCPSTEKGDLRYRARLANGSWTDWAGVGEFVGTRGKSEDLTGFAVRLGPIWREQFDVELVGVFRGDPDAVVVRGDGDCIPRSASDRLSGMQILLHARRSPMHHGDGVGWNRQVA
jgi:hypothetical protein